MVLTPPSWMAHILHSSGQSSSSIATSLCSMTYATDREEEIAVTMACQMKRRALGPKEELTSCFPCKPVGADWQGFFLLLLPGAHHQTERLQLGFYQMPVTMSGRNRQKEERRQFSSAGQTLGAKATCSGMWDISS